MIAMFTEYPGYCSSCGTQFKPSKYSIHDFYAGVSQECSQCRFSFGYLTQRPTIVCLCGSTRFWRTFQQASLRETLAGKIVLSIGAATGTDDDHFGGYLPRDEYDAVKRRLDELHLRKIELADEVLILNVDGYLGESTRRELAHARALGKAVRWWDETLAEGE